MATNFPERNHDFFFIVYNATQLKWYCETYMYCVSLLHKQVHMTFQYVEMLFEIQQLHLTDNRRDFFDDTIFSSSFERLIKKRVQTIVISKCHFQLFWHGTYFISMRHGKCCNINLLYVAFSSFTYMKMISWFVKCHMKYNDYHVNFMGDGELHKCISLPSFADGSW